MAAHYSKSTGTLNPGAEVRKGKVIYLVLCLVPMLEWKKFL